MSAFADLYLIRHGHSEHHRAERLPWPEAPLSEEGHRQAAQLATHLAVLENVTALYSSPFRRAWDTTLPIAAALGMEPIPHPDLREIEFGQAGGLTLQEFRQHWPELMASWEDPYNLSFQWPSGESRGSFQRRAVVTMETLVQTHLGQRIIIVAHTGPLRCYLAHLFLDSAALWREIPLRPASISRLEVGPKGTLLHFLDDVSHLKPLAGRPSVAS